MECSERAGLIAAQARKCHQRANISAARSERIETKQCGGNLGASRAHQAGEADDLARMQRERDVLESPGNRESLCAQNLVTAH